MANRYVVVPTVTVLAVMKGRLTGAVKGHALLKKKADALTMRFRQILKKIVQTKQDMGKNMRQSAFALTEAKYAAGDFRHTVFDGVETATVKVHAQQDNVAGKMRYARSQALLGTFNHLQQGCVPLTGSSMQVSRFRSLSSCTRVAKTLSWL